MDVATRRAASGVAIKLATSGGLRSAWQMEDAVCAARLEGYLSLLTCSTGCSVVL